MLIGKFFKFRLFAFFAGHWVLYQDVNQVVRGSPDRDIMAKPNGANICPKRRQSRRGICERTVQEKDYGCESKADPCC
jgi:hypothetical protein